jgi:RimJ/RimL family protein N-acetyltransferase
MTLDLDRTRSPHTDARRWPSVLATPRLKLRPLAFEDAPRIAMFASDAAVARMTARLPHPYSEQDARAFIASAAAAHSWAVVHANGVIGVVGLDDRGAAGLELGYWLGKPFWGRGIVTEAAGAVIIASLRACSTRAVTACHFEDNPASGRVLEKLGFQATGTFQMVRCIARNADVRAPTYRLLPATTVPASPNELQSP